MREELQKRDGCRGRFSAEFVRYGWRRGYRNVRTALFCSVCDCLGEMVTDHIWFTVGTQIEELRLKAGDRVTFTASVGPYRKGVSDNPDDGFIGRELDYRLRDYRNMRREGEADIETLPLFAQDRRGA